MKVRIFDSYLIFSHHGFVEYATNDPEKDYQYKAIVKESYEDAIKKVSATQDSTNRKQAPEDEILDRVADEAVKIFSDRYKLLTTRYEAMNDHQNKISKISFDMETRYLVDIEEARKLIFNCVDDVVFLINSNKSFAEYFTPLPFTEEGVQLNLLVLDENNEQHKHPVLWSIRFADGEIVYSTCYEKYPLSKTCTSLLIIEQTCSMNFGRELPCPRLNFLVLQQCRSIAPAKWQPLH